MDTSKYTLKNSWPFFKIIINACQQYNLPASTVTQPAEVRL